ncbi:unnamed protein product [Cochlearia groenlandica]
MKPELGDQSSPTSRASSSAERSSAHELHAPSPPPSSVSPAAAEFAGAAAPDHRPRTAGKPLPPPRNLSDGIDRFAVPSRIRDPERPFFALLSLWTVACLRVHEAELGISVLLWMLPRMQRRFTRSQAVREDTSVELRENFSESSHDGVSRQVASDRFATRHMEKDTVRQIVEDTARETVLQTTRPVRGVEPIDDHAALLDQLRGYRERFRAPSSEETVEVMQHMKNMGLELFRGIEDLTIAYNLMRKLKRNLDNMRFPIEFTLNMSVQYLRDDALAWWEGVVDGSSPPRPNL